jgi:hypothetical protein
MDTCDNKDEDKDEDEDKDGRLGGGGERKRGKGWDGNVLPIKCSGVDDTTGNIPTLSMHASLPKHSPFSFGERGREEEEEEEEEEEDENSPRRGSRGASCRTPLSSW